MSQQYVTYYKSPIGMLKIGAADGCINELSFADDGDDTSLVQPTFSNHPILHQCTEQLIEFFNGRRTVFQIPIYQAGTEFQQRVWNQLLQIPFGKTISYTDLAKRLGDPKVIRAAASTNGKNKIAIIVPCHRVIGANQSLVGFSGGLWRKKWLLQHEFKYAWGVQTLF